MRKQKWRGLPARLVALGLAAALCLGMSPVSALAEGEGDPSGDDSSSEFVGSDALEEIFVFRQSVGRGGYVSGNFVHLADVLDSDPNSVDPTKWHNASSIISKGLISLSSDWELESNFYIQADTFQKDDMANCVFALMDKGSNKEFAFLRMGHLQKRETLAFCNGQYYGTIIKETLLDKADLKGQKKLKVVYQASTRLLTVSYAGKTCSRTLELPGKDLASVRMSGEVLYAKAYPPDPDSKIEGEFVSARYTHYTPQFVSTELLDEDGNTMSDEEKLALQDGDVV
ncbi:hypothetical protein H7271_12715, partial [Bittarella massiliensis]|uniref:hypothetical protein n=1 Tax=Bittarella massiliensis (ex Durand et al. 2017) TaxID=1720313 RepID=UPI00163B81AD